MTNEAKTRQDDVRGSVGGRGPASGPTEYVVSRTAVPWKLLASLTQADAAAWDDADRIDWGPLPYRTWFRALWSDEGLFLRYDVEDAHPWFTMQRRDDPLWEEEVVEIFLDPNRSGHHYAELEVNPANVVCDVRMLAPWPHPSMDLAWNLVGLDTRTAAWPVVALPPEVASSGAPRVDSMGWSVVGLIPWPAFASLPTSVALPPKPADRWKFNVFRIKRPAGPGAPRDGAILSAWSPTGGPSFHVPAAFRDLVFR